jgi:hypothetical protein
MVTEGVDAIDGMYSGAAGLSTLCIIVLIPLHPLRGYVNQSVRLLLDVTWLLLQKK